MSKGKSKRGGSGLMGRVNPHAAGIDLGARSHYVALPSDVEEPVRQFGCYTEDLEAMAAWLKKHGVTTVAMESTGVYWVPVFQMLEKHGLDVQLVGTRHLKSVPGRKTDVADCQWIQHLHECGLLRGSFRPADAICVVRAYVRHRDTLTEESTRHILRMQKALDQMNVQLHKVLSDITGETGMAIIDAILEGERDGKKLAARRNYRCKLSEEEIAKALVGDFREEHLFCLRQEVDALRFVQKQLIVCESEILARLEAFEAKVEAVELTKAKDERPKNREVRLALFQAAGVDLTLIPGLGAKNLESLVAEVGLNLDKFRSEKAFASWAGLAPKNFITGGKRHRAPQSGASRVGQIFRVAALTLASSKSALGGYYRRMRARKGPSFAMAATAHKLAKLFFHLLTTGQQHVERGADYYEKRFRARRIQAALKLLKEEGLVPQLMPTLNAVP